MAGISFLYDEYKKNPGRVEKLLSGEIEISEKLDASRFSVQLNKTGEFTYYKRKDIQITKIDRTLAKYYEKAIFHFENLPEEKRELIPEGWRFGMEYFPNLQPVTISYDNLPLNNLVLTYIQVKDPRDKTLEVIADKETLFKWADILEIEKPPLIFKGKLIDTQKRKILDFLNTPSNSLIDRFKTENFTYFILTLLNPLLKSSFLNNNLNKDISGLVFRFDGKEAFRISNPEIILTKTKKREEKPSDIYNLTLVILQEFMTSLDFKKIKLKEKSFEDRYIEFVCKVFNIFVKSSYYEKNFTGELDFELPKFLTRQESGVNFQFVKDDETQKLLNASNTNRELFKILLASLRTHKKKPSGFFSKELVQHHNVLVDNVADYLNSNLKESFFTFEEFKSVFLGESNTIWEEFGKDLDDGEVENLNETVYSIEGSFPSFKHITKSQEYDNKKPLVDVLKRMYTDEPVDKKSQTDICLMKGKFFPFHNGHVSSIKDASTESGKKVFLLIVSPRTENLVSKELHRLILDDVVKNEKEVAGYDFTNGRSVVEMMESIPSQFNIKTFSGSTNECEDVVSQNPEIEIVPSTRHISSGTIIQKIKDEDYDGYKKLVPEYLWNLFYKIKNELSENI